MTATTKNLDPNRPNVPMVMPLVRALYQDELDCNRGSGPVGGHLRILLDDGNVDNDSAAFCLNEARKDNCATCIEIAELVVQMSRTQRTRLYLEKK